MDLYQQALDFLKSNQFASGGLLVGLGAVSYRKVISVSKNIWHKLISFTIITFNLSSREGGNFYYFRNFIVNKVLANKKTATTYTLRATVGMGQEDDTLGVDNVAFPVEGRWYTRIGKAFCRVQLSKSIEKKENKDVEEQNIQIKLLRWKRNCLIDELTKYNKDCSKRKHLYCHIRSKNRHLSMRLTEINPRTVILRQYRLDNIKNILETFYASKDRFYLLGIPYKLVILLYGPPGNGKTSLVRALASMFRKSILSADIRGFMDIDLSEGWTQESFVLLEDIDRYMRVMKEGNRQETIDTLEGPSVTLPAAIPYTPGIGEMLNKLDGIEGGQGNVIFLTANSIDEMDTALIRPGRVDHKILIENADHYQIVTLAEKFYGNLTDSEKKELCLRFESDRYSMATMQGHFLCSTTVKEALQKDIVE